MRVGANSFGKDLRSNGTPYIAERFMLNLIRRNTNVYTAYPAMKPPKKKKKNDAFVIACCDWSRDPARAMTCIVVYGREE